MSDDTPRSDDGGESACVKLGGGGDGEMAPSTQTDGGSDAITTILRALANQRRRYVLYCLADRSEPMGVDELARQVFARETGTAIETVTDEDCERVKADLYHRHLPRLEESGVIDFDRRSRMARSWDHGDLLTTLVTIVRKIEEKVDV